MPKPISRRDLISRFREFGFSGPFNGGKHMGMKKGNIVVKIPNPHGDDILPSLLLRILKQAGISKKEWKKFNL